MKWIGGQTLYNDLRLVGGNIFVYRSTVGASNPTINLGLDETNTNRLEIETVLEATSLDSVKFQTYTTGSGTHAGRFIFYVDEVNTFQIKDSLINIMESGKLTIGNVDILSDFEGTTTLSNIDALDATTIATFETAMEANLDTFGSQMTSASSLARVGTITTGVWQGTAIAHAYIGTDAIETDNIADAQVTVAKLHADAIQTSGESFADNDTSLMTSAAIDDAILKGGSNTIIKILPHHFLANEDGGANKSIQYVDNGTIGVKTTHHDSELFAFIEIPIGKTATSVIIYGSDTGNAVDVYEADINASGLADKTPGGGCVVGTACDITDVVADATNYLVIRVTTTNSTGDLAFGGAVTISG